MKGNATGEVGRTETKKGGLGPLIFLSRSERNSEFSTDGARWRPPAAGDQRMDSALRHLLLVSQIFAVDSQSVAIIAP